MRRLRIWLLGLLPVIVIVAVLGAVLAHRTGGGVDPGRPGTVLLVSGYGGSTVAVDRLATTLRRDTGRRVVVVPPAGDNTGDLAALARNLARVAQSEVDGGAPSVDVVAYSAGGVAARIWVARQGGRDLARRVVTIASPHHGTEIAGVAAGVLPGACPLACRQLAPGSDLLTGLPEVPRGPTWVSIWSADDDVVEPPDSAVLSGAVDVQLQQVCADSRTRHSGMPTDPLVEGLVERALGAGVTSAPAPTECASLQRS